MDLNTTITRSNDFVFNEIDGEMVMMNIETGKYVSLNQTGKTIWHILEQNKTITQIIEEILAQYDVSQAQCTQEVSHFITQMVEQEVVKIV